MENKELHELSEIYVNAQPSDGTTTIVELDQETTSKRSDLKKILKKIIISNDFKEKWGAFDADGSIIWLVEKLAYYSVTRRIFSAVFLYYFFNQKKI